MTWWVIWGLGAWVILLTIKVVTLSRVCYHHQRSLEIHFKIMKANTESITKLNDFALGEKK